MNMVCFYFINPVTEIKELFIIFFQAHLVVVVIVVVDVVVVDVVVVVEVVVVLVVVV